MGAHRRGQGGPLPPPTRLEFEINKVIYCLSTKYLNFCSRYTHSNQSKTSQNLKNFRLRLRLVGKWLNFQSFGGFSPSGTFFAGAYGDVYHWQRCLCKMCSFFYPYHVTHSPSHQISWICAHSTNSASGGCIWPQCLQANDLSSLCSRQHCP